MAIFINTVFILFLVQRGGRCRQLVPFAIPCKIPEPAWYDRFVCVSNIQQSLLESMLILLLFKKKTLILKRLWTEWADRGLSNFWPHSLKMLDSHYSCSYKISVFLKFKRKLAFYIEIDSWALGKRFRDLFFFLDKSRRGKNLFFWSLEKKIDSHFEIFSMRHGVQHLGKARIVWKIFLIWEMCGICLRVREF